MNIWTLIPLWALAVYGAWRLLWDIKDNVEMAISRWMARRYDCPTCRHLAPPIGYDLGFCNKCVHQGCHKPSQWEAKA